MAETRESTIIDVKLDAGKVAEDLGDMVKRIQALKAEQANLTAAIKAGNDTNGEYAKSLLAVKDQLSWCQKQANGLSATTKLLNSDTKTYDTSLNGQRQLLADMQKAYAQLDKTQRESEGGKKFLDAIKSQSDAVEGMESAMGDNTRNVGNYQSALQGVIPQLGGFVSKMSAMLHVVTTLGRGGPQAFSAFTSDIKSATSAGLKFIATPFGAVIAAIAIAAKVVAAEFGKLADAFKKNDDAGTALARMMASFQPILTAVNNAFDTMANGLGKLAGKIADFVGGLSDASRQAQQLVTDVDNLEETERQYTVNSAKRNKEVARLRNEAAQAGDPKIRKQKLQQAIELKKKNLADEKAIAQQRVKNLEREARKNADTSDEMKNKIAQAKAAQYQAEEAYYSGTRRMAKELTAIDAEEQKKRQEAAEKAAAKRKKTAEKAAEARKAAAEKENEIARMAEDFTVQLIKDEGLRAIAERKLNGEREIADLQNRLAKEKNLTETAKQQLADLILAKQAALDSDLSTMQEQYNAEQAQKALDADIERYNASLTEEETYTEAARERNNQYYDNLASLYDKDSKEYADAMERKKEYNEKFDEAVRDRNAQREALLQDAGVIAKPDQLKQQLDQLQEALDKGLISEEEYNEAVQNLYEQTALAKAESVVAFAQQCLSAVDEINNAISAQEDAELERYKEQNEEKKDDLKKKLNSGLIAQEKYDASVAQLDEELEAKQAELDIKQAKREKAIGIMTAVINTAAAIMKIWAETPKADWGVMTGVLTALAAATGAAQIATIAAEPLPTAGNGMMIEGPSHANGGVLINAEGGEAIINKKATKQYLPILSRINQSTGGVSLYGDGGIAGGLSQTSLYGISGGAEEATSTADMAEMMAAAVAAQPAPVLDYKEFTTFQKNVVQSKEVAKI